MPLCEICGTETTEDETILSLENGPRVIMCEPCATTGVDGPCCYGSVTSGGDVHEYGCSNA